MTTIIANPIYDSVFKFMMEDKKVAKILLSALLKKEIVDLDMRPHEYTSMEQTRISLFRIDFSARVRNADGTISLILIELQKTWLITETLRFRQYLGTQYLSKDNIIRDKGETTGKEIDYGMPIVSIYILGHVLGDLTEPVIYVRRSYLDYDDNLLPSPDRFIESLTHDSIIVQIPFLTGRNRNRLERILSVFDQEYRMLKDEHFLEISDESFQGDDLGLVVHRLLKAAATPEIRRAMEIEDEILTEIEDRDTTIMVKNREIEEKDQEIEERDQVIGKKDQEIEERDQVIGKKDQEIEEKDQVIGEKDQVIGEKDQVIGEKDQVIGEKDQVIGEKDQVIEQNKLEIEKKEQILRTMVKMLCKNGMTMDEIAIQLSLPIAQIRLWVDE